MQVEVIAAAEVHEAQTLTDELHAELGTHLRAWHPVAVPAGTLRTPTDARLRVHVKKYQPKPAGSPFAAIGLPGIPSAGAGLSILHAGAGAQELGALPYAIFGGGFLAVGVAALATGIALESRKSYLDRKRGYPLHAFKAEVRIIWPVGGGLREEKEVYRALDLGSAARPMSAQEAADPSDVRREMMRAFAIRIREDIGTQTGWGRPDED